ncbi:hypothetical protein, partial [Metallibacterium sp.]
MSEMHPETDAKLVNSLNKEIVKPAFSFESVTFSNDDVLTFEEDEIVVFVGPNNAGKSAALREMQQFVSRKVVQNVIKDATLRRSGTQAELLEYLEKYALKTGLTGDYRYAGIGYNIHQSHIQYFDQPIDHQPVASFFCTRLATETRIVASNPAGSIELYKE